MLEPSNVSVEDCYVNCLAMGYSRFALPVREHQRSCNVQNTGNWWFANVCMGDCLEPSELYLCSEWVKNTIFLSNDACFYYVTSSSSILDAATVILLVAVTAIVILRDLSLNKWTLLMRYLAVRRRTLGTVQQDHAFRFWQHLWQLLVPQLCGWYTSRFAKTRRHCPVLEWKARIPHREYTN